MNELKIFQKPREVWACSFRDRVAQHAVCSDIMPKIESTFIEHSFSCIKGRGTGAAIRHAERCARKITKGWSVPALALKVDIANFFCGINRGLLLHLMHDIVGSDTLAGGILTSTFLNNPIDNCLVGGRFPLSIVPINKSLFNTKEGVGLAIGWLTSRLGSNIYLDGLDKYVKHILKVKHYSRYVDDILVFGYDEKYPKDVANRIDFWLRFNRMLHLHPNKTSISDVYRGVDFVGANILPWRTVPRKSTILRAIKSAKKLLVSSDIIHSIMSVNSYLGLMRSMSSFRERKRVCSIALCHPSVG